MKAEIRLLLRRCSDALPDRDSAPLYCGNTAGARFAPFRLAFGLAPSDLERRGLIHRNCG